MDAKTKLLKIVQNSKGDDLERALMAFRGMTQEELNKEYGQSGKTRQQILVEYYQEREEWKAADDLARSL